VTGDTDATGCEDEAARLLPWYVVGRLSAGDAERVERHLERCAICRDDLTHERELRTLMKSDVRVEYAPHGGLAKTLARIDEAASGTVAAGPAAPPAGHSRLTRWLTAAVVVQAVGLGTLGALLLERPAPAPGGARYTTLAASRPTLPPGPRIRVVFAPTTTLAELRSVLAGQSLSIVQGPSAAGAFTLASAAPGFDRGRLDTTIAALRGDARLVFVEPATDGGEGAP
jgi:anti-sigma-K factor RskA